MSEIDEDRGEGRGGRQPCRTNRRASPPHPADDDADHGEVQPEADDLPDGQRQRVGHQGQRGRDQEENRWIKPGVIGRRHANLLLAGIVQGHVVDVRGPAIESKRAGCVEAGEIGAQWLAVRVDQPVGCGDPAGRGQGAEAEQDQAVAARPRGGQPLAGSQSLPDVSYSARELYECCAESSGLPFNVP